MEWILNSVLKNFLGNFAKDTWQSKHSRVEASKLLNKMGDLYANQALSSPEVIEAKLVKYLMKKLDELSKDDNGSSFFSYLPSCVKNATGKYTFRDLVKMRLDAIMKRYHDRVTPNPILRKEINKVLAEVDQSLMHRSIAEKRFSSKK